MTRDPGFHVLCTLLCRYIDSSLRRSHDVLCNPTLVGIGRSIPNALQRTGVGLCHQPKLLRQEYHVS